MSRRKSRHQVLRRATTAVFVAMALATGWLILLRLAPPPDPYGLKPAGRQFFARDGSLLRGTLSIDQKLRLRVTLREINPALVAAVLEYEDRWFHYHPGVNAVAVARAAASDLRARRIVCGASTITMQLARLTSPDRRSWVYKLRQTFRALQYESLYSKNQILEMYLNLAPYGANIEGVAAASYAYFGKSPAALSLSEAALLAVIPQSPAGHDPIRCPAQARAARDRLIDRLQRRGLVDPPAAGVARTRPLPNKMQPLPFQAPHFCEWVGRTHADHQNLHTTLEPELQAAAQQTVMEQVASLRAQGINQGAAVILDTRTSEMLVQVGSANFGDSLNAGQVNGAVALRSPGSTLKPLVYALALDRGLIAPSSLLEDIPTSIDGYAPQNYDRRFLGLIRADEALATSRNVPAVLLEQQIEERTGSGLYQFMQSAGVTSLRADQGHYGLSLVLGGGDVTLVELASLYATLARQGLYKPVRTLSDDPEAAPSRLISAEAAWLTLQMLIEVARPDLDGVWQAGVHQIAVPWKTGTSYGHRDAWAVGVAGPYVVAAWLGNFSGAASPELVGHDVAGPLLFRLIALLPQRDPGTWSIRPAGVDRREVCALSGEPAAPQCPDKRWEICIRGVSPAVPCRLHRRIQVDARSDCEVCSRCRVPGQVRERTVVWWPPEVAAFLTAEQRAMLSVPPHNPACPVLGQASDPRIEFPANNAEFELQAGVPLEYQRIALSAVVSPQAREIYWFADGLLFFRGSPQARVFLDPVAGDHVLTVRDDHGGAASVTIRVDEPETCQVSASE